MPRSFLTALCLAALILPASADDEEYKAHIAGCAKGDHRDVVALSRRFGATSVLRLTESGLASATALYNSFPPESNDTFDYAWAVDAQGGSGILVLAAARGECTGHFIAREAWPRIRATLIGT